MSFQSIYTVQAKLLTYDMDHINKIISEDIVMKEKTTDISLILE